MDYFEDCVVSPLLRYSLLLPLHELWKQYIRDLCNGLKPERWGRHIYIHTCSDSSETTGSVLNVNCVLLLFSNPQTIQQKFLKADLHGAMLTGGKLISNHLGKLNLD